MNLIIRRLLSISPYSIYSYLFETYRSRTSRPNWQFIQNGYLCGLRMWLDVKRNDIFLNMVNGDYDSFIYKMINPSKYAGKVVWEVGAYMGYHTLGFAKMVGTKGKVVVIEPNRANRKRIEINLNGNADIKNQVHLIPVALGAKPGKMKFITTNDVDSVQSSGGYLNSVLPPLNPIVYRNFESVSTMVETIDSIVVKQPGWKPDLINIDVEGAEAEVIMGGIKTLGRYHPVLFIEVHHIKVMKEIVEILIPLKYQIEISNVTELSPSRAFLVCK